MLGDSFFLEFYLEEYLFEEELIKLYNGARKAQGFRDVILNPWRALQSWDKRLQDRIIWL